MAPPKKFPVRGSQRRNAEQDYQPVRGTRSGRGNKSASAKGESNHTPKASPSITRKSTRRSSSNVSTYESINVPNSPRPDIEEIFAHYAKPVLKVFNIPQDFLINLPVKTIAPTRASGRPARAPAPLYMRGVMDSAESSESSEPSESSEEEEEEEEEDVKPPPKSRPVTITTGRGRGGRGRGGRGGRGSRGGRGRGGGRGASSAVPREISPKKVRPTRHAAPAFPLMEEDEEDSSNHETLLDARDSDHDDEALREDVTMADANDSDQEEEPGRRQAMPVESTTPPGSPPPHVLSGLQLTTALNKAISQGSLPVPKISLPRGSSTQTPQGRDAASTPAEAAVPALLDPEDDVLSDSDLLGPWVEDYEPPNESECDDKADYLLKTQFKPMTNVQDIIASLTKYPVSQRSTASLYAMAENTFKILKAWQDEYLMLDARTAPHAHPPKKPAQGGRIPLDPLVYEDMKEADLYGYAYDPKKGPGNQDPFAQRPGAEKVGGRELRQRRARDMLGSAAPSEDEEEEEEDNEGRPSKRIRRAAKKFDLSEEGTGANTPKRHSGWGGARKKGVSRFNQAAAASETPEPEGRGRRGARAASALLPQRIQEMREESGFTSSADEGSSPDAQANDVRRFNELYRKRGRPAGSKNHGRRSDYGIKKGPRKKNNLLAPSEAKPAVLQSLSEGQNQFSLESGSRVPSQQSMVGGLDGTSDPPPRMHAVPVATVFQATPQPTIESAPATSLGKSEQRAAPDKYMNATPLSQYGNSYAGESSATPTTGTKRKPRVKSEKRSQSMTIWWAERKARQRELEARENANKTEATATPKSSAMSRKSSKAASSDRRREHPFAKTDDAENSILPSSMVGVPQMLDMSSPFLHSPNAAYAPAPTLPPPSSQTHAGPKPMLLQSSPLAAPPSSTMPQSQPPTQTPTQTPNQAQPQGSRSAMPPLAPAPMPLQPQQQTYPSPYGPRTIPRPKSSGPPPLAPAPTQAHLSPYPLIAQGQGGMQGVVQGPVSGRKVGE
ncbi:uncharacterized protein BDR25DRAFT_304629 [Lindgomyces ingoldianus]|uniref:Uncharacterized protein n=1 Tax=Lindgomyces ingoldianus TaxID=673940 RepID=A0ACB6QSL6_9PLEO|nr:uncharacterized protein BDR25DRAFT_304629 [Lindgomyces ingoldianus]KAF2469100.1 hypothetical protein BDR25DRAFT_304629 [Lindgomyces ingoldianus]